MSTLTLTTTYGDSDTIEFTYTNRTTLLFVDADYIMSDGASGNILLDLNDGVDYELMLNVFSPHPASQRQELADSPLVDGRKYLPGLDKLEDVVLPFSIKILGDDDGTREKATALLTEARKDVVYVVFAPYGAGELTFYSAHPSAKFNASRYWQREYKDANIAVVDFDLEASCGYGIIQEIKPLENRVPNAGFEEWTLLTVDDWTITVSGSSAVTKEETIFLSGSKAVKFVRNGGDCEIDTTGYISVDEDHPFYLDGHIYSTAALEVTIEADCYDADGLLGTVSFTGDTRGATAWDKHVHYLVDSAQITEYHIASSDFPDGTTKAKLRVSLNEDGTIYLDELYFGDADCSCDNSIEGVMGLDITGISGDLPALCDITFGNPFGTPVWKSQTSGVTKTLYAVVAVDSTTAYVVGADGTILKTTDSGQSWVAMDGGVNKHLYGATVFDATHIWAVGKDGKVRFCDGTTWSVQTLPHVTYSITNAGMENWVGDDLNNWDEVESGIAILPATAYKHGGSKSAKHEATATGNIYGIQTTGNFYAINPYRDYTFSAWQLFGSLPDPFKIRLQVLFYNSSGTYLGYKEASFRYVYPWTKRSVNAALGDYPSGTAKTKLRIRTDITGYSYMGDYIYWDDVTLEETSYPDLYDIESITATNLVAVGEGGSIYTTNDGGTTWVERASGTFEHLYAVSAVDATHIYAVGKEGTILFSADGTTWTAQSSGTTERLYGVCAIDSTHIYAVGANGTILFSDGTTWTALTSGTVQRLNEVSADSTSEIRVVGSVGTILKSTDGTTWTLQPGPASVDLRSIDNIAAGIAWIVGDDGTILRGEYSASALAATNIVLGQRDGYHEDFNPVVEASDGDLAYSPYRRFGNYRELDATETADFLFNLAAHHGNRYAITAGMTFDGSTAFDKGTLQIKLQTTEGTPITGQYLSDEVDLGDPNTDWKEVMLQAEVWNDLDNIPSHVVSHEAALGNIDQLVQMIANASLGAVKLQLDYVAIMPLDRFTRIDDISANYLIIDSTKGTVLDSLTSSPSTAMVHDPTDVIGTPRFVMDPAGVNMVLLSIRDVSDDQRVSIVNMTVRWRSRYKLHA